MKKKKKKRAKDQYNVFVADRGNLQFHYPRDWEVTPKDPGIIKFEDPEKNCLLEVSYLRLPKSDIPVPTPEWQLEKMLKKNGEQEAIERIEVSESSGQLIAGVEQSYEDPEEFREALRYTVIINNNRFQALITFCYWPELKSHFRAILQKVLDSLVLSDGFQYSSPQQALEILSGPKH